MTIKEAKSLKVGDFVWTNRRIDECTARVRIEAIERGGHQVHIIYDGGLDGMCAAPVGCFSLRKPADMICLYSGDQTIADEEDAAERAKAAMIA